MASAANDSRFDTAMRFRIHHRIEDAVGMSDVLAQGCVMAGNEATG
ncbi:MAG TPA: hypothetical protein VIW64_05325 [Pyrinomonadaceae bacterium]|jgi:hypothetical protein